MAKLSISGCTWIVLISLYKFISVVNTTSLDGLAVTTTAPYLNSTSLNTLNQSSVITMTTETSSQEPQIDDVTSTSTSLLSTPVHEILGSDGPDKKEQEAIIKALDWLKVKRAPDYGWNNDTHVVILAKELSGSRDTTDTDGHLQVISDLEDMLSVKEMEIEILAMLDRHHALPKPLNFERLSRYVLALGSLCKDPKHFHGHDLVATLQHHEPVQDLEFALTTLSACSSAAHVRKRQIRRLLDIASGVTDQSVETIAMV